MPPRSCSARTGALGEVPLGKARAAERSFDVPIGSASAELDAVGRIADAASLAFVGRFAVAVAAAPHGAGAVVVAADVVAGVFAVVSVVNAAAAAAAHAVAGVVYVAFLAAPGAAALPWLLPVLADNIV